MGQLRFWQLILHFRDSLAILSQLTSFKYTNRFRKCPVSVSADLSKITRSLKLLAYWKMSRVNSIWNAISVSMFIHSIQAWLFLSEIMKRNKINHIFCLLLIQLVIERFVWVIIQLKDLWEFSRVHSMFFLIFLTLINNRASTFRFLMKTKTDFF